MTTFQNLATLTSSATIFGSKTVPSEEIDAAFGMPAGKLRGRAGIHSVARAADGETEVTLGTLAAKGALLAGEISIDQVDLIVATSETHHEYPSLAAQLHLAIGAGERCGAMDVGGACLGLLYALVVAKSFVECGSARNVLVATADVHSRTLTPERVAGEFGGLFGDGAAAFVVRNGNVAAPGYLLRDFFFGCSSQLHKAIRVVPQSDALNVVFDGDALSRAATGRLEQCICELESLSGTSRNAVKAFATHQPNPRLLALLARKANIDPRKFPPVAEMRGNLGSTTCAAALHSALTTCDGFAVVPGQAIFLASLGPGLLFGGGWLRAL
jgi:3-oxoacyl-[acyl-carrier-protein] synthase-3